MSIIRQVNRVVTHNIIFHAYIGNFHYASALSRQLPLALRETVSGIFRTLTPAKRPSLKDRLTKVLKHRENEGSNSKFCTVRDLLPLILSFLTPKEIVRTAEVDSQFFKFASIGLLDQIENKSIHALDELSCYASALHLRTETEVLTLRPKFFDQITRLDLSRAVIFEEDRSKYVENFPNLTHLTFPALSDYRGTGGWQIRDRDFSLLIRKHPHLESIQLPHQNLLSNASIELIAQNYAGLTDFTLTHNHVITNPSLALLAQNCRNLDTLDLSYCGNVGDDSVALFPLNCAQLKKINLSGCYQLTDASVSLFSSRSLTSIDLAYSQITDFSITQLMLNCPYLTSINLAHCKRIQGHSIVAISLRYPNLSYICLDRCSGLTQDSLVALRENCRKLPPSIIQQLETILFTMLNSQPQQPRPVWERPERNDRLVPMNDRQVPPKGCCAIL